MRKYDKIRSLRHKIAALCATTMMVPCASLAQEAPQAPQPAHAEEEIVVTGSRIARRELDTPAPVAVTGQEEFQLSGTVSAEQVINALPQVIAGSTAFSNNGGGGGASTLDLRGLGRNRTMVLVNGRRWMFYGTNQVVDTNTIPTFLIKEVNTVTGGASAVYGSDAVAGVVDFVLRKDLVGVEAGAQYSVTGAGDGPRYEAYIALGTGLGDGRGHATVFGEYYNRSSIYQSARAFSFATQRENDDVTGFIPGGSPTTPFGTVTSRLGTTACPAGNVFCSPGAFYASPGVSRTLTPDDLYNFAVDNYLMVPQERYLLGGFADYEISPGHTAYTEVTFVNNRVANELAPTPVTGTFNVDIASVAPFISASDVAALREIDAVAGSGNTVGDGVVPLSIRRRINETGARNSLHERNAFRFLVGMRGAITDTINYDAYYQYARTRNSNEQDGNISRSAVRAGLDGTATPINIFGPKTLTPAMVDQISILAQNGVISTLQVANAAISGSIFNLGMGAEDVGFALGGEYRKMSSQFIPDTALSSGDVIGFNAGEPTAGAYSAKEVFAELRIPIAAKMPGIERLEVTGAARYSKYSLEAVGGVWTYAAGLTYAPVRDITFRGQYQRAVRAPNVEELYGGQSFNFPSGTDPCADSATAADAKVRELCIATGVPADRVGMASVQPATQIQGLFGGNADLQEETSDSYTAGVVLRPRFIPGLSITADWYNIKVAGTIDTFGGGLINTLNLCYNVIQDINSRYCQVLLGSRNPLGQFDGENPPKIINANIGRLEAEGIDLQVAYNRALGFSLIGEGSSRINFQFTGNYTIKNDITPVAELPDQFSKCAGGFGDLICGNPIPKYKWTTRLSWIDGPLTSSLRWRHLSAVRDDQPASTFFVERIPAYNLFDLSFSFDVSEKIDMSFGVNNLFNKTPTILGNNQQQANTWPSTYDVIGRDFFVSGRLKF